MEQEKNYSAKHVIIASIIGAVSGFVFGGIVKLLNLNLDSAVELIASIIIALGALWLSLIILKKHKNNNS
jgi:type III secretory pathway component EscS